MTFEKHLSILLEQLEDFFPASFTDSQISDVVDKVVSDNHIDVEFEKINSHRMPAMFAPGKIYLSEFTPHGLPPSVASSSKLFTILHELGHAYRYQNVGNIYNYFLKKDIDENPISRDEAIRAIMNEEVEATKWANSMVDKYQLPLPKHQTRYPMQIVQQSMSMIEESGVETVEEVVELLLNSILD